MFLCVTRFLLLFKKPQKTQDNTLTLSTHTKDASIAAFTLIELVIALGVFAIVLTLAAPSFRTMLMNSKVTATTDGFVNALNYARNTALTQGVDVAVCPLGALNSTACGADWNNGWIVVTQPTTGVGALLQTQQFATNDAKLNSATGSVTFDSHGLATTQSNFAICDERGGTFARSVEVLPTGYVQSGETVGVAVWNNGAIACP